MPRTKKTTTPKHPTARARERAKRQGLIKNFMATASPYVNIGLHYVTGDSPPNTKHTQQDLAFAAAVKLKLITYELNIAANMLAATDPLALSVQQALRIQDITRELSAIGDHAEKHTARAARHQHEVN